MRADKPYFFVPLQAERDNKEQDEVIFRRRTG